MKLAAVLAITVCLALGVCLAGCGGSASPASPSAGPTPGPTPGPSPAPGPSPTPNPDPNPTPTPAPDAVHVVMVVEENHSYDEVINGTEMPYLKSLAQQHSLATNYFADTHPSEPNYFMLTTGQLIAVDDSFVGPVDAPNLAGVLAAAGKTWKSYAEDLPSVGFLGDFSGAYVKRHNPFAFFSNVINDSGQVKNLVPFPQFAADLAASALPDFSFVIPNQLHNAHDSTLAAADAWLQQQMAPLLADAQFQKNGLLIVVFDESEFTDLEHGGGHVAVVMAGPKVKAGFQSTTFYQHASLLRFVLETLGVTDFPGASAGAPSMSEFLN